MSTVRLFEVARWGVQVKVIAILLATVFWLVWPRRRQFARRLPKVSLVLFLALGGSLGGCVRPCDTPEYAEIDTSETGFLIPLEGDSGSQAKFQSEQYLRDLKVAAKRVQITHRWSQEGRVVWSGRWIPMVRLIKVNRSPVTREWTAENNSGTATKNEAIWIESADSVGFSWASPAPRSSPRKTRPSFSIGIRAARSITSWTAKSAAAFSRSARKSRRVIRSMPCAKRSRKSPTR